MPDVDWQGRFDRIRRKLRACRLPWKRILGILVGLIFLLFAVEIGLNLWVRTALRHSLLQNSESGRVRIERFGWLTPGDFLRGRVNSLKIDCRNCRVGEMVFEHLSVDSEGFRLDPGRLLFAKTLVLISLNSTSITARITAAAATDYLMRDYAAFQPKVQFFPGGLEISGETELWENRVPVRLSGGLALSAPRMIRFFPERLSVSGRQAPRNFLRFLSGQIPLEITVLQDWPLRMIDLKLKPGILIVAMREME